MSWIATLVLAGLLPQGQGQGRLILPPVKKPEPGAQPAQERNASQEEVQSFLAEAARLRRSVGMAGPALELHLQRMGERFRQPAQLALGALRKADADLAFGLLKVVQRFGAADEGRELLYIALTKPYGSATREVLSTMAALLQGDAREALFQCLAASIPGVQRAARELLQGQLVAEDLPRLLELAGDRRTEVAGPAMELLGVLPSPQARECLLRGLRSTDVVLAQTACNALLAHGLEAAPDLAAIVAAPARDRGFGYAAFALALLEDRHGKPLVTEAMAPNLLRELQTPDTFAQATAAYALSGIAFRSNDTEGKAWQDEALVEAMLQVVAPRGFVANFALLDLPLRQRLELFTGERLAGAEAWREWWKVRKGGGFLGLRQRIELSEATVPMAVLGVRSERLTVRFRGPALRLDDKPGVLDFVLEPPELLALVARLEQGGFLRTPPALPPPGDIQPHFVVSLELGRVQARYTAWSEQDRLLPTLERELAAVAQGQRWQLYRNPKRDGDALAWWREGKAWLAQNQDPAVRARRLKELILGALPELTPGRRATAHAHLVAIPDLASLLTEQDGEAIAAWLASLPKVDDAVLPWVEVAILAPGDRVWRAMLDLAAAQGENAARAWVARLFGLLGADKVLACMADPRRRIRLQAMDEIANLKDLRAVPILLKALDEEDPEVVRTAVFSLGRLRAAEARPVLLARLPSFDEATRRTAWIALGRIGGAEVVPVLQAALSQPAAEDRMAAVQALGEVRDPRAAQLLAYVFTARVGDEVGSLAGLFLRRQGALLARPALRPFLRANNPQVRREVVLLLAELGDPEVIEDLLQMVDQGGGDAGRAVRLIAGLTGVDASGAPDPVRVLREWWVKNRDVPQAQWYLAALRKAGIDTRLGLEQLRPRSGVGAVSELTRILLATQDEPLRALTLTMLRDTTEQDFGGVQAGSPEAAVQAIAERYRFHADSLKAADGK